MNFNQLKYIVAVDRHRNFSQAADECGVAQSTLSKEIQRLEKEFGILIFDRSRFPVVPTMKGIDLVAKAREILVQQEEFEEIARQMVNRPKGSFRLGVQNLLAPYILPLFVQSLSRKYPELQLDIREASPQGILARFDEETLDGAVVIAPFVREGFYEDILYNEEFVLYVSLDDPLAKKEEVRWDEIPWDDLILHETFRKNLTESGILKSNPALEKSGLKNTHFENGSLETLRKIVDRNGGMTILPELSCLYMGERRLQMVRKIVEPSLSQKIVFVTPRGFEKRRLVKVIKDEIVRGLKIR